jgi:hypothetical protein
MIPLIEDTKAAIVDLGRRFGVRRLALVIQRPIEPATPAADDPSV